MPSPKFEFYLTVGMRLHVVSSFLSLQSAHLIPSDQTDRIVFPEFALSEDSSLRCFVCCTHILATCTENRTSLGERTRPGDVTRGSTSANSGTSTFLHRHGTSIVRLHARAFALASACKLWDCD
jgi:hypothetical protein